MPCLGHKQGVKTEKKSVEYCLKRGIKYLSLYTFSLENFKRSKEEVSYLFDLLVEQASNDLDFLIKNKVKVRFIGDKKLFPSHVMPSCKKIEDETEKCDGINVNIVFCYGGQQEILAGVKAAVEL